MTTFTDDCPCPTLAGEALEGVTGGGALSCTARTPQELTIMLVLVRLRISVQRKQLRNRVEVITPELLTCMLLAVKIEMAAVILCFRMAAANRLSSRASSFVPKVFPL